MGFGKEGKSSIQKTMRPVSQAEFKPKAEFTFFSLSTCGYCKVFKGEMKDEKTGQISIDPNSGWETLRNDPDLYKAGVQFVLYQVGDVKDPVTGKVKRYQLEPEYKGIRGFPHLRLSRPDDRFNGTPFDGRITGWRAEQSVTGIKSWILQKLKESPFKDYQVSAAQPSQSQPVQAPTTHDATKSAFRSPPPTASQDQTRPEMSPSQAGSLPGRGQAIVRHHQPQPGEPEAVPAMPPPNSHRSTHHTNQPNFHGDTDGNRREVEARPAATVFGLGTRQVSVIPNGENPRAAEPKPVKKPAPKFLPSNYDQ